MRLDSAPNVTYQFNGQEWVREDTARNPTRLWKLIQDGKLKLTDLNPVEQAAVRKLMRRITRPRK
jgi:hypothetical protein